MIWVAASDSLATCSLSPQHLGLGLPTAVGGYRSYSRRPCFVDGLYTKTFEVAPSLTTKRTSVSTNSKKKQA